MSPRLTGSPHTHSMFNVPRTMVAVMVCLTPATGHGFLQFGWPAVILFAVTLASAILFEILCLALAERPIWRFTTDGSALLTGWLVAMSLPPWAPWWVGVTGAGIAIVVGKHMFGGLGQNIFNPAMVARAMLLIALPVQMTVWVAPIDGAGPSLMESVAIIFAGQPPAPDALSGATFLSHVQSELDAGRAMGDLMGATDSLREQFFGLVSGSLGETSAVLLLAGGIALILLRIITPVVPLAVLGSLYACAGIAHLLAPGQFPPPLFHLASGATMMCAFFIATDYVTAPVTGMGKAIYGVGIGVLIFVIRSFGSFPEGVAFAVLLMNACTPLIDVYVRPRIFGRTRKGAPLELETKS